MAGSPSRIDAVVIGAGHAGLAASHELASAGIDHVVLERGRIGETWRTQRWDSFRLNSANERSTLPGGETAQPADGFDTAPGFVAQLERYAGRFSLPIEAVTSVTSVEAGSRGRYALEAVSEGARPRRLLARAVVIATGMQNVPRIPELPGDWPAGVERLHGAAYRNPDRLPPGAVLVIGSAQSGVQIAEDLVDAGRRVYLCTSRVGRAPRRYRGRDIFNWLLELGFMDARTRDLADQSQATATMLILSGTGRYGHTVSLQDLARRGVTLLGRPRGVGGDRLALDDTLGPAIAYGDERSAFIRRFVDDALGRSGRDLPPTEPDPADEPHPDPLGVHSPPHLDLGAAGIRSVIWATGFGGDFGWLRVAGAVGSDGTPRHVDGVGTAPGLYCVGFPWLSRRKSGLIVGANDDAADVVRHLVTYLAQ